MNIVLFVVTCLNQNTFFKKPVNYYIFLRYVEFKIKIKKKIVLKKKDSFKKNSK